MSGAMGPAEAQGAAEAADLAQVASEVQAAEEAAEVKRKAEAREAAWWHPETALAWISERQPGDAMAALMQAIRAGRIGCSGRMRRGGKLRQFTAEGMARLLADNPDAVLVGDAVYNHAALDSFLPSNVAILLDVRLPRDEMLAVWPPAAPPAAQEESAPVVSGEEVLNALEPDGLLLDEFLGHSEDLSALSEEAVALEATSPAASATESMECPKESSATELRDFVTEFFTAEKNQGRTPTQIRLREAWRADGHKGHRAELHAALANLTGKPRRGRPAGTRRK